MGVAESNQPFTVHYIFVFRQSGSSVWFFSQVLRSMPIFCLIQSEEFEQVAWRGNSRHHSNPVVIMHWYQNVASTLPFFFASSHL
jgi:hypothetical protein